MMKFQLQKLLKSHSDNSSDQVSEELTVSNPKLKRFIKNFSSNSKKIILKLIWLNMKLIIKLIMMIFCHFGKTKYFNAYFNKFSL